MSINIVKKNNISGTKSRSIKKSRRNKIVKILAKSKSWNLAKFKNFTKV